ncbi:class I SAM-dependent methyltransferase [Streptomyces sp. NPDC048516]|uniref:class I SAM-dependent methyltransferase n=1 Tax=Streptomyces sp. NPDC048516 TaxID=3365565 RepID=UPI00371F46EA
MHRLLDRAHRALFAALSLLGLRGQGRVLHWYFDWWHRRPDPWGLAVDDYEQFKYATTLRQLPRRPYRRILDVGCSEGAFTHRLAAAFPQAEITGVDISERALARARASAASRAPAAGPASAVGPASAAGPASAPGRPAPAPGCERPPRFERLNILTAPPEDRFDLVFCAELLYYLGRHRHLRRACAHLTRAVAPGGLLVLVHPWPESRRFCAYFEAVAGFRCVVEQVEPDSFRPFAVSVYEAPAAARPGVPSPPGPGAEQGRGE